MPNDMSVRFHFRLTEEALSADRLIEVVSDSSAGAVAAFAGVVRGTTVVGQGKIETDYLIYEAYSAMAHKQCLELAKAVFEQWPKVIKLAMEHRTGLCKIGEPSVLVAASSPHRGDGCFEACQFAIERLKASVPIWKQEHEAQRSSWVEGKPEPGLNVNLQ